MCIPMPISSPSPSSPLLCTSPFLCVSSDGHALVGLRLSFLFVYHPPTSSHVPAASRPCCIFFVSRLLRLARSLHCCREALETHRDSGKEFPRLFVSSLGSVCVCVCLYPCVKNGTPPVHIRQLHCMRPGSPHQAHSPRCTWMLIVRACYDVTQEEL